jgi:hypothetical protein
MCFFFSLSLSVRVLSFRCKAFSDMRWFLVDHSVLSVSHWKVLACRLVDGGLHCKVTWLGHFLKDIQSLKLVGFPTNDFINPLLSNVLGTGVRKKAGSFNFIISTFTKFLFPERNQNPHLPWHLVFQRPLLCPL